MDTPAPPSRRRILTATAVAFVTAVVVLVTAVLPAEYGIDPLGTGKMLGLTALAGTADDETLSPSTLAAVGPASTRRSRVCSRATHSRWNCDRSKALSTGTASSKAAASCTRGRRRRRWATTSMANPTARRRSTGELRQGRRPFGPGRLHRADARHTRLVLGEQGRRAGDDHAHDVRLLPVIDRVP